jgi:hypothetical protein
MTPTSNFSHSDSPRPAAVETVRGLIEQVADMPVSEDTDILLAELEALHTRLEADAARVAELEAAQARSIDALKAAYEMLDEAIEYVPGGRQRVETINSRNMAHAALKALEGDKS